MGKENEKQSEEKRDRDENGHFLPGHSIQSPGRPKGSVSIVEKLKRKLEEVPQGEKKQYADLLVEQWVKEALEKEDFNALKEIVRYIDGMPKATSDIDITSLGDKINSVNVAIVDHDGDDQSDEAVQVDSDK